MDKSTLRALSVLISDEEKITRPLKFVIDECRAEGSDKILMEAIFTKHQITGAMLAAFPDKDVAALERRFNRLASDNLEDGLSPLDLMNKLEREKRRNG